VRNRIGKTKSEKIATRYTDALMLLISTWIVSVLSIVAATQPSTPKAKPSTPTITWERSTLRLVAADAHYARIIRLKSGAWVAGYSRGPAVWSSISVDAGVTWTKAVRVGDFAKGLATNSELIQLADGRVMYLYNERERQRTPEEKAREPDNGIAVAFSSDDGKTWSRPKRIYGGGPMWEPAAIERGSELSVLFADEKPFSKTNEQQITKLVSRDGGKTWGKPEAVSFRKGHRDGMAVPVELADGSTVMAIEDDGLNGTFKPVIIDLSHDERGPVGGQSRHRWSALAEPLPAEVYAGAPYLIRLGAKATVLSAQVAQPGGPRQMAVWVGDVEAKQFVGPSSPFVMAGDAEQLWNALLPLDEDRVLAVTGIKIEGKSGVWTIEGKLTW
jgi:hypothetical protein